MIKILTVIGARPQLIKAAAISREIKHSFNDSIEEIIVHTGQHYDENMSGVFFEELAIPKEKYNLKVGSGSHAYQTSQILLKIEEILIEEKPDYLLLYGDTNSTIAAALAAIKLFIPIIHVEAGVRSYNKEFPEEVNRVLTDHLSTLLFTPTQAGFDCLIQEGFNNRPGKKTSSNPGVYQCGDIMYDNTLFFKDQVDKIGVFKKYTIESDFVLLTMHRPSNVDNPSTLAEILTAVLELIDETGLNFVFPVHPRTVGAIKKIENESLAKTFLNHPNINILPPVSFHEMIVLEDASSLVITDSGGVQKEAYFLQKACLIMLDETPWTELIDSGCARLVGNNKQLIKENFHYFYGHKDLKFEQIYGDGNAALFILQTILKNDSDV